MTPGFLKSINIKVVIIYMSLAIINISFFTGIIFENQIDLITENTKLKSEKIVASLVLALKRYPEELNTAEFRKTRKKRKILEEIENTVKPLLSKYIIFSDNGKIITKSKKEIFLPKTYLADGLRSLSNKTFTGRDYYLTIDEKEFVMNFYVPLNDYGLNNTVLYLPYSIKDVKHSLKSLYSQAILMVIITSIFHILFAIILYRVIILPISILIRGSKKIANGDLTARVHLKNEDEFGILANYFNQMADSIKSKIDNLAIAKDKIEKIAITDDLTGLYNRRFMFLRIREEMNRSIRTMSSLAFILLDIDHFKSFNDTHGHQVGDFVLKKVAETVRESCREIDTVSRYGGEEIAVIAPECSVENLLQLSERIRVAIENCKIDINNEKLSVTVSIGSVSFDLELLEAIGAPEVLIHFADVALYRAKANGRNRCEIG